MDISEVVDATGDIASSPFKTQKTETETSTQRPEGLSSNSESPSTLPELSTPAESVPETKRNWSDSEYPSLDAPPELPCQQAIPRRERATTSSGTSVKRSAPTTTNNAQPSASGIIAESKSDEGGKVKRQPSAVRELLYNKTSQSEVLNVRNDDDVLPPELTPS